MAVVGIQVTLGARHKGHGRDESPEHACCHRRMPWQCLPVQAVHTVSYEPWPPAVSMKVVAAGPAKNKLAWLGLTLSQLGQARRGLTVAGRRETEQRRLMLGWVFGFCMLLTHAESKQHRQNREKVLPAASSDMRMAFGGFFASCCMHGHPSTRSNKPRNRPRNLRLAGASQERRALCQ